jgi:DNA-directed RNA polymerase subunit RPC12/RpoP
MAREDENHGFHCISCGTNVQPLTNGSYRNHCPACLCSVHADVRPGDRKQSCGGLMEPVALAYHSSKRWQIVHRCVRCGALSRNKVADGTEQPDDVFRIARLSGRESQRRSLQYHSLCSIAEEPS